MGKLGKKARKFAKKNLQSVLRQRRKSKPVFRKKRDKKGAVEDRAGASTGLSNGREVVTENLEDVPLRIVFSDNDADVDEDVSDSDGLLPEDSSCLCAGESRNINYSEENSAVSSQNQKIQLELKKQKEKLERLKQKDPGFADFLLKHRMGLESPQKEDELYSDEDEMNDHDMQLVNGNTLASKNGRLLTSPIFDSWCMSITKQHSLSALPSLLNAYRSACHYGSESKEIHDSDSAPVLHGDTFGSILLFVLRESDTIFRSQLGISPNSCKTETLSKLENNSKWKLLKPMVQSYLRSTLLLLNQVTDTELLVYSLTRIRASLIFFATSPALLRKLIEVSVNLWATSGGTLSSSAFLVICDVATFFGSDWYQKCLKKVYKAFMERCKVVEHVDLNHVRSLRDSIVELCSIDWQKSVSLALSSTQKLAKILQVGLQTNKKEALEMICSWEYVLCMDLWVTLLSAIIEDNDLHEWLVMLIQVINGIVHLFPGPRYLPLRVRCIQWLNQLSFSSGIFIPISSLVLDVLEYRTTKEVGKSEKVDSLPTSLKFPKHYLKSQNFQKECVFAVVELLCAHFEQWSYHISFPELATIPLIHLRQFHGASTVESLCNMVKRLIDQVENNIDFVQKKRDGVSYAPKDKESAASFLQAEKGNGNAPFIQYYRSVLQKAALRGTVMGEEKCLVERKISGRRKRKPERNITGASLNGDSGKSMVDTSAKSEQDVKIKKQRR